MKVSKNWLAQYAAIPVDTDTYQSTMIMKGTGIEGIDKWDEEVRNVVVGRILSVKKHENSDHMLICQVDVGDKVLQIVTGAPNVAEGQLVPVAVDGAILPGGKKIQSGKLRGELSQGMLCSGPELNVPVDLYPSVGDEGILVFGEDYPLGSDVKPILGVDDQIIDFEILANRPDCQCVWGVARETAVAIGTAFVKPEITVRTVPGKVEDFASIAVLDNELCPRYVGRVVKNVRIAPSPMWMRAALHAAGMHSINNIVDITNYVMLETGHPMHAFDLRQVRDGQIIVREARTGESIRTLDGKDRAVTPGMLVIADGQGPTGVAGVMGGEESEITEATKDILFECAAFDRTSVRLTARALGLRTESSGRFEKGVCPATAREAIDRACQLVNLLDAGDVVEGVFDHNPNPAPEKTLTCSVARVARRTGVDIPAEDMVCILQSLHFGAKADGDALTVTVPTFRQDVTGEADISEEVLRIYGYEHIGATLLRGETTPGGYCPRVKQANRVKALLTGMGFSENISFSFVSPKWIDKLGLPEGDARLNQLRVLNPLGEDTSVMRASLAPSLLTALAFNQSHNNAAAWLYEIAPVFDITGKRPDELPHERWTLCMGGYGPMGDFYSIRGALTQLLSQFGLTARVEVGGEPYHHPGRSAKLMVGNCRIATLGEVHPDVADSFALGKRVLLAELDMEALLRLAQPMGAAKPLPKFPAVTRDLALVMPEPTLVGQVIETIRQAGGNLLEQVDVFDVYRGAQLITGKKSVAFSLAFRAGDRTLSDTDVSPVFDKIVKRCTEQYEAEIRG